MRHHEDTTTGRMIWAAAITLVAGVGGAARADQVENGGFDDGIKGWQVVATNKEQGPDTHLDATVETSDTNAFGGDKSSATFAVNNLADFEGGPSFVSTELKIFQRVNDIEGLTLQFSHSRWLYDVSAVTSGAAHVSAEVSVQTAPEAGSIGGGTQSPPQAQADLFASVDVTPNLPCNFGIGVGSDDPDPMQRSGLNLAAAGFEEGDDVIISFTVTVITDADSICDAAYAMLEVYVDDVEITP